MHIKACELHTHLLASDHLDVAASFCNMADAQHCLGNDTEAITGYEAFISIATEKFGSNHTAIASVLTTMGQMCYTLNDCHIGIKYSYLALQSSLKAYGPNDEKLAAVLNLIGTTSIEVDEIDHALMASKSGLRIERKTGVSEDEIVTTPVLIVYGVLF